MAKSKIIKDLASNSIDLEVVLKQLKLLLIEFDKTELVEWVNHELQGYPTNRDELPEYRVIPGILKGNFLNFYTKVSNTPIPFVKGTPDEVMDLCSKVPYYDGIPALKAYMKKKDNETSFGVQLSAEALPVIQHYSAISMTCLLSATIQVSEMDIYNILSTVENKVLDVLLLLEKEFGCLDDLDLDMSIKSSDELAGIEQQIYYMIFDNSVHIGDKNKIVDTDIITASNIGGEEE